MVRSRKPSLVGLLFLVGCSTTPTTPLGSLGEVDLSSTLPKTISVREAELRSHETTQTICAFDKHEGATVTVRWKTWKQGADAYVTHYSVELVKPADALTVTLDKKVEQRSAMTDSGAFMGMPMVELRCRRKVFGLDQTSGASIQIKADGSVPAPTIVKL
jgi:hypothetical protein